MPVRIRLTPSKPKRFRFGAGYETDNGLGMLARYHDQNLIAGAMKSKPS